jgi:hypothetical protein
MASSEHYSATPDELRAIDRAFTDRRHDAERYRQEAARLRRGAKMKVNVSIAEHLIAVARHFDELATSVEEMRARQARP